MQRLRSCVVLLLLSFLVPVTSVLAAGPPCKIGDIVRAGALNYDAKILSHDRAKGLYKVEYVSGGSQEWVPDRGLKTCTGEPPPEVTEKFFMGTWNLWTGGGGAYVKKGNTYHATWLDTAKAPPLTIRPDGTYTWVVHGKPPINGKWRVAQKSELKYGYDKRGLALLIEQGYDGASWLVTRELAYSTQGHDAILLEHHKIGLTYAGYRK